MAIVFVDSNGAGEGFVKILREKGYKETPRYPIYPGDQSVLFMNATITPLKPEMNSGILSGKTCQMQRCFRATGEKPYLFGFSMVGAVVEYAHLPSAFQDCIEAVLGMAKGLKITDLVSVIDQRDGDLIAASRKAGIRAILRTEKDVRFPGYGTRWKYGDDCRLTGRGLTLVSHDNLDFHLGNVIVVEGPVQNYVEIAFGVEVLQSLEFGFDLYELPELKQIQRIFSSLGFDESAAKDLTNLERGISWLVRDGVTVGNRGAGYILRKFTRKYVELISRDVCAIELEERLREVIQDQSILKTVLTDGLPRFLRENQRVALAEKFLKKSQTKESLSPERLVDTFGIGYDMAVKILKRAA
ncbi:hypothetical protein [Streptomyces virginiae]|uniref:hypothetical protein n=1 Tax=Streptomyces virginiae TaxID=1961 RepID=UPI000D1496ED|nr:hypothetical protein [Streptomyces virginiae]